MTFSVNDRLMTALNTYTGALPERLYKYLGDQGHTQYSLPDRINSAGGWQFLVETILTGGVTPPPPSGELRFFSAASGGDSLRKFSPHPISLLQGSGDLPTNPGGVAVKDGYVYVSMSDGTLRKYNASLTEISSASISVDAAAGQIALGADGYIYAGFGSTIHKIDTDTMSSVGSINPFSYTIRNIVYGDDGYLYASEVLYGSLSSPATARKIDPTNMSLIATYVEPNGGVFCCVKGTDGFVYLAVRGATRKLNSDMALNATNTSAGTGNRFWLDYGGDGHIYIGSTDTKISKVDTTTMGLVSTFDGHGGATGRCRMGPDGFLYTSSIDFTIRVVNPEDMTQVSMYDSGGSETYSFAFGVTE